MLELQRDETAEMASLWFSFPLVPGAVVQLLLHHVCHGQHSIDNNRCRKLLPTVYNLYNFQNINKERGG